MIKEFSFGNFRSFKEIQSLNLTASKISEHTENNIIAINSIRPNEHICSHYLVGNYFGICT